ncbi:elongation factor 4, partial [Patescibacteria group bacterium]|nr:elongation factor 4 [Patescibacteria group bacterium]
GCQRLAVQKHQRLAAVDKPSIYRHLQTRKNVKNMSRQPLTPTQDLGVGEVGFIATGVKDLSLFQPGDTVVFENEFGVVPLRGYQPVRPMVYAGLYPIDNQDHKLLGESLDRLRLSDAALSVEPEFCDGLGKGYRVGFLGMLHAEIVQERLGREFGVDLIITPPTVEYRVKKTDGQMMTVLTVSDFPDRSQISQVFEPIVSLSIYTPIEYMTDLIELCKEKRARLKDQAYFGTQVRLDFKMPLGEMVVGFYDQLKNVSSGFASLDWQEAGFELMEAVRLDILFNGGRVDSLSQIIPRSQVQFRGRRMVEKLRKLIPRQQFEIRIQAAVGGKIIAKESVKPFRKDVTAKLYGGDRTRRMKLLEKQKKGKKRMKQVGQVQVPQDVFLEVFKR